MPPVEKNQLYFGDNLTVLREHIKDESVDLIGCREIPPLRTERARMGHPRLLVGSELTNWLVQD